MINWICYPNNQNLPEHLISVINVFINNKDSISSDNHQLESNAVLSVLANDLISEGFEVETSKKKADKIRIPVLYGVNGKTELAFEADAYNKNSKTIIEVEAGRAVVNYQFLKDFFEASMMLNVDYLCIAVRNTYRRNKDFEKVKSFFDAFFSSKKVSTELKNVLLIGY